MKPLAIFRSVGFILLVLVFQFVLTAGSCFTNSNGCDDAKCVHGHCDNVEESCECFEGWQGTHCDDEIEPSSIKITEIRVTRFKEDYAGQPWDLGSEPDIYLRMVLNGDTIWTQSSVESDADYRKVYKFEIDDLVLLDPTAAHSLQLYDADSPDPDDFMGGVKFTPYHKGQSFPEFMVVDAGGYVGFEVYFKYFWP